MLRTQPSTPAPLALASHDANEPASGTVDRAPHLTTPLEALPSVSLGIRIKLIALMVGTSFLLVSVLTSYLTAREIAALRADLRDRAAAYGRLASRQLRSAVAFKDEETAREVLDAILKDPLVKGSGLYREDGSRLHSEGTLSELALSARRGFGEPRTFSLPGRILVTIPVRSLEGPRGTLVMELTTGPASAARVHLIQAAVGIGSGALLLGMLFAWGIAHSIARRVEDIAHAASEVAQGDFARTLVLNGPRDEIGILALAFDGMVRRLRELIDHIHRTAREENARLEHLVGERTGQLDRKNADLQLVLDNVDQGFVTIDRAGNVVGERSRIIAAWFGSISVGDSLWACLERSNPGCGFPFEAAWSQLIDGVMPASVCLAQMPAECAFFGRHLRFEYKPLGSEETFEKLLVVISDATAVVERNRTEQQKRDMINLSIRLLNDRAGFLEFAAETDLLLKRIVLNTTDLASRKRDLHTLKGNSAIFGLSGLSALCHDVESELEAGAETVQSASVAEEWERIRRRTQQLLGERVSTDLAVDKREYQAVVDAVRARRDHAALEKLLTAWSLEPVRVRLERAAEQLSSAAERAGKGTPTVAVEATSIYLAREELSEFWSVFAHVVRNGVSHGLEHPEERAERSTVAKHDFELRAGIQNGSLFVELEDHGPGIDWETIRLRARQLCLPADTQPDLIAAIFADGISTNSEVSEWSGRGVGLSAVRDACLRQRGKIDVDTVRGAGTKFRFSWPTTQFESLVEFNAGAST